MKQTSSLIIKNFFKQLNKYPIKSYYSQPHTIQSSVGLIFKFPQINKFQTREQFDQAISSEQCSFQNVELLFVQRAGYHLDKNAYNVVFPGGQCDGKQTDLQACQRQLKQEIGINVDKQCIHIGQLPSNFYYLKKRGKQVHISCHAFCLKSTQNNWQPTLNPDQLRKFKWVPITQLLKQQNYKQRNQIKLGVFERMPSFAAKVAKQNITNVIMPELDLGMERNLWGLTLWIWSYMLQMAVSNTGLNIKNQQIIKLKNLVTKMKGFELQFKPYSFYKIPATLAASGWHYLYRVRPFTYRNLSIIDNLLKSPVKVILLIFVLIIIFWSLPTF